MERRKLRQSAVLSTDDSPLMELVPGASRKDRSHLPVTVMMM